MSDVDSSIMRDALPGGGDAGLDLEAWRLREGLTYAQLADRIDASSPRQARAWALGLERPSAAATDRILTASLGAVTVHAMHRRRLEWERQHAKPIETVPSASSPAPEAVPAPGRPRTRESPRRVAER
jgi:transcriptional regulator with XRE-family HTH domain